VITNIDDADVKRQVGEEVKQICQRFPAPGLDT